MAYAPSGLMRCSVSWFSSSRPSAVLFSVVRCHLSIASMEANPLMVLGLLVFRLAWR